MQNILTMIIGTSAFIILLTFILVYLIIITPLIIIDTLWQYVNIKLEKKYGTNVV